MAFDQIGYQKALNASLVGNFITKSPFDVGPKVGGGNNLLFASGLLTTKTPDPADYMQAHGVLQTLAGPTVTVQPHPKSG